VIDAAEPDWGGMTAEKFSELVQEQFGLTPAQAELTALLAEGGVAPDDFVCMTAGELTRLVGGNPVDLRCTSDGFYQSVGVDADLDKLLPPGTFSCDRVKDAVLRETPSFLHDFTDACHEPGGCLFNEPLSSDEAVDQMLATAAMTQCFGCMGDPDPEPSNSGVIGVAGDPLPERAEILTDAADTVTSHRQDQYGEPEDSLAAIGAYWSVYCGYDFSPKDVAIMMTLLKIARAENGYHRDNYVDAAGYLGLAGEAELNALTTPTTSKRTVN
jgi:hypothetical protein